jgi:hypothetical protein
MTKQKPRLPSSVPDHFINQLITLNEKHPRGDSNAQPTDSKSGTLSIELRGQAHLLYREIRRGGQINR